MLKNYNSMHSAMAKDRLIEPICFHSYFKYLTAFEVATGENKIFKTERIPDAIFTEIDWKFEKEHQKNSINIFGIAGLLPTHVTLKLSKRAQQLLTEEFADGVPHLTTKGNSSLLDCEVFGFEGVGRFVLGLMDEIEIIGIGA